MTTHHVVPVVCVGLKVGSTVYGCGNLLRQYHGEREPGISSGVCDTCYAAWEAAMDREEAA